MSLFFIFQLQEFKYFKGFFFTLALKIHLHHEVHDTEPPVNVSTTLCVCVHVYVCVCVCVCVQFNTLGQHHVTR